MKAAKILLAVDLGPASRRTLEWATALAHATAAGLIVVYVEPGQPTSEFGSVYRGLADPGIAEMARMLATFVPSDAEVECEHRILRGTPATEILKCAAEEQVAAIVIGATSHHELRHILLGGTSEAVLRGAHCPVMICKDPSP